MDTNIMNLLHFCRKMISIYCFIFDNCRPCSSWSYHQVGHTWKPYCQIVDNVSFLLNRICDLGHLGNWRIFGSLEIDMNCLLYKTFLMELWNIDAKCHACPKSEASPIFGLLACSQNYIKKWFLLVFIRLAFWLIWPWNWRSDLEDDMESWK